MYSLSVHAFVGAMGASLICQENRTAIYLYTLCSFAFVEALRLHGSRLSEYERQEIEKYPEIWFLGLDSCKINAKPGTALNCGYDDDNGSYNKVIMRLMEFH